MIPEVKWSKSSTGQINGPHRDYVTNLNNSNIFVRNVTKNLLNGMRVYVADSEHLPLALLTMVYKPPLQAKLGTFASSIFLHEDARIVSQNTQLIFNSLMQKAQKYNIPDQKEFPL